MDTRRAREQLGWAPRTSATDALLELLEGMRAPAGLDTPPLAPRAGGPLRAPRAAQRRRAPDLECFGGRG